MSGVIYASETKLRHARPLCREAANGFEGAFEALTNQATGFAGGILTVPENRMDIGSCAKAIIPISLQSCVTTATVRKANGRAASRALRGHAWTAWIWTMMHRPGVSVWTASTSWHRRPGRRHPGIDVLAVLAVSRLHPAVVPFRHD